MAFGPEGKVMKPTTARKVTVKKERLLSNELERHIDLEQNGGEGTVLENRPAKTKLTGIVIDGKTYTCATCKSGHRVGVCKHANERPMKPTHAPGRPAAGAPKKVVCDCPKQCNCSKDCRCPRECLCTQTMYMLVYIPGPEEEQNPTVINGDEGKWEIDREVITDLKGNILKDEEVEARRRQKEALREEGISPGAMRSRSASTVKAPNSPSEAKPKASGGCCAHQQAVEKERQQNIQLELKFNAIVSPNASTHGCNCGAACSCAFCPQHPNNQISRNFAQQQALWISQQQIPMNTNFMQFNPNVPQETSCMGGQPRFAISRHPMHPTISNFEEAFPSTRGSGYMLAYPMRGRVTPSPQPTPLPNMPMFPPSFSQQASNTNTTPETNFQWESTDDLFDIDDAMVANDGPNGWEQYFMQSDDQWTLPNLSSESNLEDLSSNTMPHHMTMPPFNHDGTMSTPNSFPLSPVSMAPVSTAISTGSLAAPSQLIQARNTNVPAPMATGGSVLMSCASQKPGLEFGQIHEDGFLDPCHLIRDRPTQPRQNYTNAS